MKSPREQLKEAIRRNELKLKEMELNQKESDRMVNQTNDQKVSTRRKIIIKEDSNLTKAIIKQPLPIQESNEQLILSEDFLSSARKPPQKSLRFDETHKRFTNYLQKDLYSAIQNLRKSGEIDSLTSLINDAIFEYLANYFSNELNKKQ
ncbi:hypothetical protein M3610_13505 [Neobacillus sp. MER 74]|uniref:hypothetical protein n=1 Tax=Neobacillus sp. MER 74 TaxID=2939566 RepID=UPI00203E72EB|nr:hypothetical protein [Neobacillus sp. MER 74]MCM3116316.1 hypothetical protein [Neobacillus sp. MER 74]